MTIPKTGPGSYAAQAIPPVAFARLGHLHVAELERQRDALYSLHRALLVDGQYEGAATVGVSVVRLSDEIIAFARSRGLL